MKLRSLISTALPALLFATTAHAVRQPEYLDERPLETADGARGRAAVRTMDKAPATATQAWRDFTAQHGDWRVVWDADTAVPRRVFGKGIAAPGSMADGAIAADAAYRLLGEHLALLAPGARVGDFVVSHNKLQTQGKHPLRVVSMEQRWNGARVVGGGVIFLFKHDRLFVFGSTASPAIRATMPSTIIGDAVAANEASRWIDAAYGATPTITEVGAPVLLPVLRERGPIEHRVVVPVTADLASPRALWTVYVDAATGAPVARRQRLLFAEGTIRYNAGARQPSTGRMDYPAAFATHSVAAQGAVTANVSGLLTWTGAAAASVTTSVAGTYARVTNEAGAEATTTLTLQPDGSATWNEAASEFVDAQLTSYIHATIAKRYAIDTIDPGLGWLSQQMLVAVNEDDICNAYSNLDDIHFFRAGSTQGFTCENTGRLADVVYHEFGHSLHGQSVVHAGDFDGALSEGISDYYAATITGDPAMGIGFFSPTEPLRHIDPAGREMVWPDDVSNFDTHVTGEIIGGALWDLRKGLIASLGQAEGVALADDIFYAIISRAEDIPASYAEALAEDDDDGNLDNGTPNQCIIDTAFAAHGLAMGSTGTIGALDPPTQLGFEIAIAAPTGGTVDCPTADIDSGLVRWQLRDDLSVNGEVALTVAADGSASATLPTQDDGRVIQYQVVATLSDGQVKQFPNNVADPYYEMFVGPVTELACFDFEAGLDGWTVTGEFEQGAAAQGSDDAPAAFAGTGVLGTALGDDYSPGATSTATSPTIDVAGFENVRLQYRRWLNVEDARYDQATIAADGTTLWTNLETQQGGTKHGDREWRFQDVDLSAQAADGSVAVTFGLATDEGLEFGGWTVDEVCIVALGAAVCGDGFVTAPEQCDDGNTDDGDGCSATCETEIPAVCPDGSDDCEEPGGCCSTSGGAPVGPLALGLLTLGLVLRRRRR